MIVSILPAKGPITSIERPEMDDLDVGLRELGYSATPIPLLGSDDELYGASIALHRSDTPERYGLLVVELGGYYDLIEVADYGAFYRFLKEVMTPYTVVREAIIKGLEEF